MNSELLAPAPADISVPRVEAAGLSAAACRKLTALFLLLLLAGATAGVVVPAGPGWDFANFYDTGRRVAAGQVTDIYDPETLIDGERPQGDMRFWGTPVSALLYAPLGYLQPLTALAVFKIQNTLALFAALVLLYLHNRKFVDDTPEAQWRFAALFAFLCLVFQPFWTIYRVGGQTTPTVFLLLVLGLLCHARSKVFLSALCVVAAVLIKPAFVTVLALLALISGLRFAGGTAVVLLASGLVSLATVGWAVHEDFLTLMLKGTSAPFPWFYNSSLYVPFVNLRMFAEPVAASRTLDAALAAAQGATKLLVVAAFAFVVLKGRAREWDSAARRHFDFLLAVTFGLLVSQTVWEHYLSLLFPLLVFVVAARGQFSRRALALVGAVFVLSVGQNLIFVNFLRHNFSFDTPLELLFIGLFKGGPLLLALVFVLGHYKELFRVYEGREWRAAS